MSGNHADGEASVVVRVGSRKSPLALAQTKFVIGKLEEWNPKYTFELITMTTTGDHVLDKPLFEIGEKSLFTKELEVALLDHSVDFVVHSLKDLPTQLPEGLVIGAVCKRINPHDVLLLHSKHEGKKLDSLPKGSVIGTSSTRRVAQLKKNFPDLKVASIRGNLNTRLKKLDEGKVYDGLVLAAAGILRMGWDERISQVLGPDACMHAVGQGALAIECRRDDEKTLNLLQPFCDKETTLCCVAERAFMKTLEGGCSVPLAVSTYYSEKQVSLTGAVFSLDGNDHLIESMTKKCEKDEEEKDEPDPPTKKIRKDSGDSCEEVGILSPVSIPGCVFSSAAQTGEDVARSLLAAGARRILTACRPHQTLPEKEEMPSTT